MLVAGAGAVAVAPVAGGSVGRVAAPRASPPSPVSTKLLYLLMIR